MLTLYLIIRHSKLEIRVLRNEIKITSIYLLFLIVIGVIRYIKYIFSQNDLVSSSRAF